MTFTLVPFGLSEAMRGTIFSPFGDCCVIHSFLEILVTPYWRQETDSEAILVSYVSLTATPDWLSPPTSQA